MLAANPPPELLNDQLGVDETRVTFLVVGFRHASFIEQCLDSCFAQGEPVRVIVVDDASGDDTADLVRGYAARTGHPITLLAHATNTGLGASLAEALALVETPFLAYIAADDWMEPERTRVQVEALEAAGPGAALVYSDVYRARADGSRIMRFSVDHAKVWQPNPPDLFHALLRGNWIPAPAIMVRTEALRAVGGYDADIFYEDHDVVLRLAREYDFVCVDQVLASHRELDTSLGKVFYDPSTRPRWLRARLMIYEKHFGVDEQTDLYIAGLMLMWLRELYEGGAPSGWIAHRYAALRPHLGARSSSLLELSRLRVPGRLVTRVKRTIGRVRRA